MRTLSTLFKAAAKTDAFTFGYAAEMDFPSGFTRVNTSPYTIQINANNFMGVGNLGSIGAVEEEATLTAKGITMSLSGIDPALVSTALTENPRGRPCKLWVCLFNNADHTLINVPYPVGTWRMDTLSVSVGDKAVLTLAAESPLSDWSRSRSRYYTDGDQLSRHPTDLFFEFLAVNIDKEIRWGVA